MNATGSIGRTVCTAARACGSTRRVVSSIVKVSAGAGKTVAGHPLGFLTMLSVLVLSPLHGLLW